MRCPWPSLNVLLAALATLLVTGPLPCLAAATVDQEPTAIALRESAGARRQLPVPPVPAVTLHVSPRGSDTAPGTPTKPFASLERCRDEIRALQRQGPLPKGGVLVVIHGGDYANTRPLSLSAEDSGTEAAPIRYAAAPGETPVFKGGLRLSGWRHLSAADAAAWPLLPAKARGMVWITDLKAAGIDEVLPLKLGGAGSGNGFITHPAHELFFNGRAMTLARGPNEGFLHIKEVSAQDVIKAYDRHGSLRGSFFYEGDLPQKWVNEPDLLLYGYWFWNWSDSYERVESIDAARRLITLAKPWHTWGYSVGAPFYAVNALSELDTPGEWYLDRARKIILFYPPSDPQKAVIELSLTAGPLLEMKSVSYVRFEGITWDLGAADAIHIDGGSHCLLVGCTVKRFAGNGISLTGGHDHGVLSCDISSLGRGGVVMSAGHRRTLEPGGDFLENCDISDLSRIDHTYTPAVHVSGVGNRITRNRLHDIPSSALRVDGNDMMVAFNEVFNVVTESDDQGGADMWGDPSYLGNRYLFNYWHDIGNATPGGIAPKCGRCGIRLDDSISGTLIYGNVFERCSSGGFGAIQINGGTANHVQNSLFIDCAAGLSIQPWDTKRWRDYWNKWLEDGANQIDPTLYAQRYPAFTGLLDNPNANRVSSNATLRCGEFLLHPPATTATADNAATLHPDFTMKSAPPILQVPGLDPIPLGEIGLYADGWRKSKK
ncbi:right-handed parallel beta-helix repeat-containing protein [soil metagenome]